MAILTYVIFKDHAQPIVPQGTADHGANIPVVTLFIDEYTAELIRQWKEYAAIHTKTRFGMHDYVFGNSKNDHYTYGGFRPILNRFLESKYNKKHGLAALHRIRHAVATKAAEEGASTIELMQLLGDNQERSVHWYEANNCNEKPRLN